jgi:DNA-directed RNA polymerase alpha subunit
MARPIRALGLPLICRLILHRAELHTVGDLVRMDHDALSQIELMTPEWMNEIERSLAGWGLRLGSN